MPATGRMKPCLTIVEVSSSYRTLYSGVSRSVVPPDGRQSLHSRHLSVVSGGCSVRSCMLERRRLGGGTDADDQGPMGGTPAASCRVV